jgi:uncharacterized protein YbbC (DUF1343 family)
MISKKLFLFVLGFVICSSVFAQDIQLTEYGMITTGSQRFGFYGPKLKGKRVAVVANKASMVGNEHLIDFLLRKEVRIVKVFSPEHGFRADADAGEKVESDIDAVTGLQIVSLYGYHKKPTHSDLENIDVVVFDLQDVGVRFYTYISTLSYVMEACAENQKPLILLDRPNPNGYYVDGPVLEAEFKSFVGMHPIPIVYGMTIGEFAFMINEEGWLFGGVKCNLEVVAMKNYTHNMIVKLPVKPSPNLPNWESVYLYPSLCLFEGTVVSVGRGTDFPFQVFGHPGLRNGNYSFTPKPNPGSSHPKLEGKKCFGMKLSGYADNYAKNETRINLSWLIDSYDMLANEDVFFNDYFDKLAGTDKLRKQLEKGISQDKIRNSWKAKLKKFNKIRKKYLIYN